MMKKQAVEEGFDYRGFSKEWLEEIADDKNALLPSARSLYWPVDVYGYGRGFRAYGRYPSFLPLHVWSRHGAYDGCFNFCPEEYVTTAAAMFVFSEPDRDYFVERSKVPCYVTMNPAIFYRRHRNIQQVPNPKGTLVFPSHTSTIGTALYDREDYIRQLKALPEKFQPVAVSLHYRDIATDGHLVYLRHSIPVYTAGIHYDIRYAERFYGYLRHFKYAAGNAMGSHVSYAVEMGIPYFTLDKAHGQDIVENRPEFDGGGMTVDFYAAYPAYREFFDLFNTYPRVEITEEQRQFVLDHCGATTGISRWQMTKLLYGAYLRQGNPFKDAGYLAGLGFRRLGMWFIKTFFRASRARYLRRKYRDRPATLRGRLRALGYREPFECTPHDDEQRPPA